MLYILYININSVHNNSSVLKTQLDYYSVLNKHFTVRPDGREGRVPHVGPGEALRVQLAASLQVQHPGPDLRAAYPGPGQVRVHLQWVPEERGDPLPLHGVRRLRPVRVLLRGEGAHTQDGEARLRPGRGHQ